MNRVEAEAIARAHVARLQGEWDKALAIKLDLTEEHDCGWLFAINSRRYWETLNAGDMLVGLGRLLVPRDGKEPVMFPSSQPTEAGLADYRAGLPFGETRHRKRAAARVASKAAAAMTPGIEALILKFVSGADTSIAAASAIEVALNDVFPDDEYMQETVDMLAMYRPGGGEYRLDEAALKQRLSKTMGRLPK